MMTESEAREMARNIMLQGFNFDSSEDEMDYITKALLKVDKKARDEQREVDAKIALETITLDNVVNFYTGAPMPNHQSYREPEQIAERIRSQGDKG